MHVLLEPTHLFRIAHVPLCSPATGGVTAMMVRPSSSSPEGMEPPSKKPYFGAFLRVSSRYACVIIYCLTGPCFSHRLAYTQEVLSAWLESYLGNSNSLSVSGTPCDNPVSVPGGADGDKCE
jgi:hypothetical protein